MSVSGSIFPYKALLNAQTASTFLEYCDDSDFFELLDHVVQKCQLDDSQILKSIVIEIEKRQFWKAPQWAGHFEENAPWLQSDLGIALLAEISQRNKDIGAATTLWQRLAQRNRESAFLAGLSLAKIYQRHGEFSIAYQWLRSSLTPDLSHNQWSQASRLYSRLKAKEMPTGCRPLKVAILGTSTTQFVAPILDIVGFQHGLNLELFQSDYGTLQQTILDTQSPLYRFQPNIVILMTHWRDANLPPLSEAPEAEFERVFHQWQQLWSALRERLNCTIIQNSFDYPVEDSAGYLGECHAGGRRLLLSRLNQAFATKAPHDVLIADLNAVITQLGRDVWDDSAQWYSSRQYPAAQALPALCQYYLAIIRAALGMSSKVLVVDLDNTLWHGVIGEDGITGIHVGPDTPEGEVFADIQAYLKELKERGILLVACSKNNDSDARLPFIEKEGMVLALEDFAGFYANWNEKAENLKLAAKSLNLPLESFVFLDDNPMERAAMQAQLPQVKVVELPTKPERFLQALQAGHYFDAISLSQEDRSRESHYKANLERQILQTSTASLDDYLQQLQMIATVRPFIEADLERITQLFNKTNQFNLTTQRFSQSQVTTFLDSQRYWTLSLRLRDAYGDNGLIALMVVIKSHSCWTIDSWLMSCRVLGRGVEKLMLDLLAKMASSAEVSEIIGHYWPTEKNAQVANLYTEMGFKPIEPEGDIQRFRAKTAELKVPEYYIAVEPDA